MSRSRKGLGLVLSLAAAVIMLTVAELAINSRPPVIQSYSAGYHWSAPACGDSPGELICSANAFAGGQLTSVALADPCNTVQSSSFSQVIDGSPRGCSTVVPLGRPLPSPQAVSGSLSLDPSVSSFTGFVEPPKITAPERGTIAIPCSTRGAENPVAGVACISAVPH